MNSFRFLERGVEAELDAPARADRGGGDGRAGDAPLRPGERQRSPRCARRRRRTTTATSPSPTWCRWRRPRRCCARPARRCRSCRRRGSSATRASWAWPRTSAALLAADPETADYFERAVAAADGVEPQVVANWVTGELAAALRQGEDEASAADSKVEPAALAALVAHGRRRRRSPTAAARPVLATLVAEGGDPAAIVEREGLAQIVRQRRAGGDRRRRDRGQPRGRRADPRRQRQGDRRDRRRRDEGDQGPRRRRRGQPPDPARSWAVESSAASLRMLATSASAKCCSALCNTLLQSAKLSAWPGTSSSPVVGSAGRRLRGSWSG